MFKYYVLALKRYVDFKGRSSRPEYWWFVLANFIISILLGVVSAALSVAWIGDVYTLVLFVPSVAIAVRRLRDSGHSGWNYLWLILPWAGTLLAQQMGFMWITLICAILGLFGAIRVLVLLCMPTK